MSVFDVFYQATLGAERAKKTQSEFDQRYQMTQKGRQEREGREQQEYERKRYEEAQKQAMRERESDRRQQLTMELVKQRGEAEEYKREQPWIEEEFGREEAFKVGKERRDAYEYEKTQARLRSQNRISNALRAEGLDLQADRFEHEQQKDVVDAEKYIVDQARKDRKEEQDNLKFQVDYIFKKYDFDRKNRDGLATASDRREDNLRQQQAQTFMQQKALRDEANKNLPPEISTKQIVDMALMFLTADPDDVKKGTRIYANFGLDAKTALTPDKAYEAAKQFYIGARESAISTKSQKAAAIRVGKEDSYDPSPGMGNEPFVAPQPTGLPSGVGQRPPFPETSTPELSMGLGADLDSLLGGQQPPGFAPAAPQGAEPEVEPYTPPTTDELKQQYAYATDQLTRARLSGDEAGVREAEVRVSRLEQTLKQSFMPEEVREGVEEYGEGPPGVSAVEKFREDYGLLQTQGDTDLTEKISSQKDMRKAGRMIQLLRPEEGDLPYKYIPDMDQKGMTGTQVWVDRETGETLEMGPPASDEDIANYQIEIDPETGEWKIKHQEDKYGYRDIIDPRYDYDEIAEKWAPILYRQQQLSKLTKLVRRKEKLAAHWGLRAITKRGVVGNVARTLGAAAAQFLSAAITGANDILHPIDTLSDFFDEDNPSKALHARLRDVQASDSTDWLTRIRQTVETQDQKNFRAGFRVLTEEWTSEWAPIENAIGRVTGTQRLAGESVWDIFAISPYEFVFDVALDLSKDVIPDGWRLPLLLTGDILARKGVRRLKTAKMANKLRKAGKFVLGSDWDKLAPKMAEAFENGIKSLTGPELRAIFKDPKKLAEFSEETLRWAEKKELRGFTSTQIGKVRRAGDAVRKVRPGQLLLPTTKTRRVLSRDIPLMETKGIVAQPKFRRKKITGFERRPGGVRKVTLKQHLMSRARRLTQGEWGAAPGMGWGVRRGGDVVGGLWRGSRESARTAAGRARLSGVPDEVNKYYDDLVHTAVSEVEQYRATVNRNISLNVLRGAHSLPPGTPRHIVVAYEGIIDTYKKSQRVGTDLPLWNTSTGKSVDEAVAKLSPADQDILLKKLDEAETIRWRAGVDYKVLEPTRNNIAAGLENIDPADIPAMVSRGVRDNFTALKGELGRLKAQQDLELFAVSLQDNLHKAISRLPKQEQVELSKLIDDMRRGKGEGYGRAWKESLKQKPAGTPKQRGLFDGEPPPPTTGAAPSPAPPPKPGPAPVGTAPTKGKPAPDDTWTQSMKGKEPSWTHPSGFKIERATIDEAGRRIPVIPFSRKQGFLVRNKAGEVIARGKTLEQAQDAATRGKGWTGEIVEELPPFTPETVPTPRKRPVVEVAKPKPTPEAPAPKPPEAPAPRKPVIEVAKPRPKAPEPPPPSKPRIQVEPKKTAADKPLQDAVRANKITPLEREELLDILRKKKKNISLDDADAALEIAVRAGVDGKKNRILEDTLERVKEYGHTPNSLLDQGGDVGVRTIIGGTAAPPATSPIWGSVSSYNKQAHDLAVTHFVNKAFNSMLGKGKKGVIKKSSWSHLIPAGRWDPKHIQRRRQFSADFRENVIKLIQKRYGKGLIQSKRDLLDATREGMGNILTRSKQRGYPSGGIKDQGQQFFAGLHNIDTTITSILKSNPHLKGELFITSESFRKKMGKLVGKSADRLKGTREAKRIKALEKLLEDPAVIDGFNQVMCMVRYGMMRSK